MEQWPENGLINNTTRTLICKDKTVTGYISITVSIFIHKRYLLKLPSTNLVSGIKLILYMFN